MLKGLKDEKKNESLLNIAIFKKMKLLFQRNKLIERYTNKKLFFIFLLIMIFFPKCSSKIIITISGGGTQSILSDSFSQLPSKVTINGEVKTQITKQYSMDSENTVIMEWETPLKSCSNMFTSLTNIIKVDLSNFDSSQVTDMSSMFYKCSNIKEINLNGLDTSVVEDMNSMFYECKSLTSLDFSSFNTLKVLYMQYMFFECDSLQSLNLTSFKTPSLTTTYFMFNDCDKLTYIDLSNFVTSKVNNMGSMFGWCINLISVDLSNFDTSGVTNLGSMFFKCRKLLFVNLNSFVEKSDAQTDTMFEEVPNDLIYCIGENAVNIKNQLKDISNNNNCSSVCFSKYITINIDERVCIPVEIEEENSTKCPKYLYNNTCYDKCPIRTQVSSVNEHLCEDLNCTNYYDYNQSKCINKIPDGFFLNDTKYRTIDKCHPYCKTCEEKENNDNTNCKTCISDKFFDSGNCTSSCINGYYKDSLNNNVCKCKYDIKCESCSDESIKYNLCITCNNNYYPKYNDSSNKFNFINCYNKSDGYFLDNNIYKPCYSTCKKCNITGDANKNNCIECIDNYIFINNNENNTNCYKKCDYYYYFDSFNRYFCTEDDQCPNEYQKLIKEKKKCLQSCNMDNYYKYEFNNSCYLNCPNGTNISSDNPFLCETIDLNNNINTTITEEFKVEKFFNGEYETNNKTFSVDNIIVNIQEEILKGNITLNILNKSTGEVEDLLIKKENILYHITTTDNQNNNKYQNESTIKLGVCENQLRKIYNISSSIPLLIFMIEINKEGFSIPIIEYEVYNSKQNDLLNLNYCNNTEIKLSIPVTINENNIFKHNSSSEYYNDECNTYTTDSGTDIIIKDRRNEYIENNMSLCESNCKYNGYNITTKRVDCQCKPKNTLTLFSKIIIDQDRLLNNFLDLRTSANLAILKCFNILFSEEGLKNNIGSYIILSIVLIHIVSLFLFIFKGYNLLNNRIKSIIPREKGKNKTEKKHPIGNPNKKKKKIKKRKYNMAILKTSNDGSKSHSIGLSSNSKKNFSDLNFNEKLEKTILRNNNSNINKLIVKYNDYEINTLIYEKALLYDKRTYIEYYFSLLRIKHLIIFTFYTHNDYNSSIIKVCLLFFSFALYYTVNALFFTDSTMHKIYEDEGMFNIIYQIPQILYSSIISSVINNILKYFSLTEKNVIEIKREKIDLQRKVRNTLKCLKLKFVLFFSLSLFFLSVFWYYLASFCAVYKNTQIYLIKDVLISFALTLIYPFGLCLLPGILRIPSLRNPEEEREYMYKISIIIQNLI